MTVYVGLRAHIERPGSPQVRHVGLPVGYRPAHHFRDRGPDLKRIARVIVEDPALELAGRRRLGVGVSDKLAGCRAYDLRGSERELPCDRHDACPLCGYLLLMDTCY